MNAQSKTEWIQTYLFEASKPVQYLDDEDCVLCSDESCINCQLIQKQNVEWLLSTVPKEEEEEEEEEEETESGMSFEEYYYGMYS